MICNICGDRFGYYTASRVGPLESNESEICVSCYQISVGYYSVCDNPKCFNCKRKLELMKEKGIIGKNERNGC